MSKDMVALVEGAPDEDAYAGAVMAAGPELWVTQAADGGLVQLWEHEGGRLLFVVEAPILVQAGGELERLLGPEVGHVEPPVWWVEVRASEDVDGSEVPALRFASELSLLLGGEVWMDDPVYAERAGLRSR